MRSPLPQRGDRLQAGHARPTPHQAIEARELAAEKLVDWIERRAISDQSRAVTEAAKLPPDVWPSVSFTSWLHVWVDVEERGVAWAVWWMARRSRCPEPNEAHAEKAAGDSPGSRSWLSTPGEN